VGQKTANSQITTNGNPVRQESYEVERARIPEDVDQSSLADLRLGTGLVREEAPNDRDSRVEVGVLGFGFECEESKGTEGACISSSNWGSRRKYEEYESSGSTGGVAKYGASYGIVRGIGAVVRRVGFLGSSVKDGVVGEALDEPLLDVDCLDRLQFDLVEAVSRHARGSVGAAFLL
jgi:hypothetical protein